MSTPAESTSISDTLRNLSSDPVLRWLPAAIGAIGGGGGAAYLASRETSRPGETKGERARRILTNAAAGAGLGGLGLGGTFYGASLLANPGEDQGGILNSLLNASNAEGATMTSALAGGALGGAAGSHIGMRGWDKQNRLLGKANMSDAIAKAKEMIAGAGKMTPPQAAAMQALQRAKIQAAKDLTRSTMSARGGRAGAAFRGGAGGSALGAVLGGALSFAPEIFFN